MKNAASLKSKAETPKTPGGISKSLLTPCRRVGLSRNFRKSVASPFNSPLASPHVKDNDETRKRKESLEDTPDKSGNDNRETENIRTPVRKVELPRRKKSKTLINSITKADVSSQELQESPLSDKVIESESIKKEAEVLKIVDTPVRLKSKSKDRSSLSKVSKKPNIEPETIPESGACTSKDQSQSNETVEGLAETKTSPVNLKLKSRSKKMSTKCNTNVNATNSKPNITNVEIGNLEHSNKLTEKTSQKIDADSENTINYCKTANKKSPNNLTTECVVVIQKKIFKQLQPGNVLKDIDKGDDKVNTVSQALFNDSDSDVPLKCISKKETNANATNDIDDDDDFASQPKLKKSYSKISRKEISTAKPKSPKSTKNKPKESLKAATIPVNPNSQSSMDDDDFFEKKKTILIKKTYDKVVKPLKAKSAGSITQKDIEDLNARIETKKKMLLAKSMTDTKELRELIKKWQKGCQHALLELMDLMKNKCPDQNMEYSQILQTLKIPATLVGYDSDNDCFVTPEDENIILSHIKD